MWAESWHFFDYLPTYLRWPLRVIAVASVPIFLLELRVEMVYWGWRLPKDIKLSPEQMTKITEYLKQSEESLQRLHESHVEEWKAKRDQPKPAL